MSYPKEGLHGEVGVRARGHGDISTGPEGSRGAPQAPAGGAEPPQRTSALIEVINVMGLEMKWFLNALDEISGCWFLMGVEAEVRCTQLC